MVIFTLGKFVNSAHTKNKSTVLVEDVLWISKSAAYYSCQLVLNFALGIAKNESHNQKVHVTHPKKK